MTKRIYTILAVILILAFGLNLAFGAATATQVDFLLAGLERSGSPLSGGKVFTYEAGTTTAKECWTDRDKTSSATNPIILSSEGRSTAFCDGVYKMVVKTSADVTILTMDGISYGPQGDQWTALSSYGSLSEAIADIGATDTVLLIDTTDTLNANVTVPTNVTLMVTTPDAITLNGKTLTVNGGIWAPAIEWAIGTGTFTGSPIVQFYDPTWTASTVTDSATPSYKNLTLSEPTLLTPVIADFSNSTHTHGADSSGGLIATSVRDTSRNLIANNPSTSTVFISVDEAILQDTNGGSLRLTSVSETIDITNSGAHGLASDEGEANSKWYYIWLIGNTSSSAGMISNSSTAPTLPAGYTHKGLFGAVYNDSGGDFDIFRQVDNRVIRDGSSESVTDSDFSTSCAAVDLSAIIPATAKSLTGIVRANTSGTTGLYLSGDPDCYGFQGIIVFSAVTDENAVINIPMKSQNLYTRKTAATLTDLGFFISGWEY
jgi:hypothetical protein